METTSEHQERMEKLERLVEQLQRQTEALQRQTEQLQRQNEDFQRQNEQLLQQQKDEKQQEIKQMRKERKQIQSEFTLEKEDELTLFKIRNEDGLEEKLCTKLPIEKVVDSMGSFVPHKYKKDIKEVAERNGSCAATKRFLTLATVKKLNAGWSRQLIKIITTLELSDIEESISLNQFNVKEFTTQIGIPRKSLLEKLAEKLRNHCSILVSPMGKSETVEESDAVPVVHPELCVSEYHFYPDPQHVTDGRYISSRMTSQAYRDAPRVSFDDFTESSKSPLSFTFLRRYNFTNDRRMLQEVTYPRLLQDEHDLFIFLIGPAGCGKTTITKRMVKSCIEGKKMAFLIPFAHIDKKQRLSIKNLILKFLCQLHNLESDPSEEEIDEAFQWILANQDKCLVIFDGLDQSSFVISNQPIEDPDINDEYLPEELMSLLLSRRFLPNIRLVLSSRPHSLAQLSPAIQPDHVVFINDLLREDVEKLLNHYLEHGTATEVIAKLMVKSPRIYQLIRNPLLLRLVAMLTNEVGMDVWSYINTTAKLFLEIVERLQLSAHHECGSGIDVKDVNMKLAEMAFYKIMEGLVVFEQKDLEKYGLSAENIQDFLFGMVNGQPDPSTTALLVGIIMVFYFNHQSTQEFFSARFALEKLPYKEFENLVRKLFPQFSENERGGTEISEDSFGNLRLFVIGLINEIPNRHLDDEEILMKKKFFILYLCDYIRKLFVLDSYIGHHGRRQIMTDLLDFREEGVIGEIRENLKDFNFCFKFVTEAFCHFIENFVSKVETIVFWAGYTPDSSKVAVEKVFQSILKYNGEVGSMKISGIKMPLLNLNPSTVIGVLPQFTKELVFEFKKNIRDVDVDLDVDARQQFCSQLKEEIANFDTSLLQTKELKVIGRKYGRNDPFLLQAILRPNEPPRFINEE